MCILQDHECFSEWADRKSLILSSGPTHWQTANMLLICIAFRWDLLMLKWLFAMRVLNLVICTQMYLKCLNDFISDKQLWFNSNIMRDSEAHTHTTKRYRFIYFIFFFSISQSLRLSCTLRIHFKWWYCYSLIWYVSSNITGNSSKKLSVVDVHCKSCNWNIAFALYRTNVQNPMKHLLILISELMREIYK